jgi:hypothetical protein
MQFLCAFKSICHCCREFSIEVCLCLYTFGYYVPSLTTTKSMHAFCFLHYCCYRTIKLKLLPVDGSSMHIIRCLRHACLELQCILYVIGRIKVYANNSLIHNSSSDKLELTTFIIPILVFAKSGKRAHLFRGLNTGFAISYSAWGTANLFFTAIHY